ncbi:MAG: TRAP transporter small permease [Peptococcaceae bacterium]|nr:TRAP transporter small permease [Peptococcaceae bacterium]
MIKIYNKLINLINNRLKDLAAIVLVFIVLLVVVNIILRPFGKAIMGAYDLVVILTPVVISLSVAYCAVKNGHVAIGLLVERFPKRVQKIIDFITGSIFIVTLSIATWYLVQHADKMRQNKEVTTTILIPYAPFILLVAVGIGMLALVVLGKVLNLFVKEGDQ